MTGSGFRVQGSGFALVAAAICCVVFSGCGAPLGSQALAGDVVPCELALAMIAADGTAAPRPQPTPAPAPDDEVGQAIGDRPQGWIFSDAKSLITKGNALADRAKILLDAAERDGKITLDVKLPKPAPRANCPDGLCPLTIEPATDPPSSDAGSCADGSCSFPGRRFRWRR